MIYNLEYNIDINRLKNDVEQYIKAKKRIEITEPKEKRRNQANKLYWVWMKCIEDETGQNDKEVHEYFKKKHLGTEEIIVFGNIIDKPKSTATLKVKPFYEYMQKIKEYCATELGIILSLPEDQGFDQLIEKYSWMY